MDNNIRIITKRVIWLILCVLLIFVVSFIVILSLFRNDITCGRSTIQINPLVNSSDCDNVVVNTETQTILTESGKVRGRKEYTLLGRKPFFAFKGIPYGQPPIGELRFKPPKESNSWNHVHDAFEYGNICIQKDGSGDENCLFLNIFVPSVINNITDGEKSLPVLLSLHGGGFCVGSGADLRPDFIIDHANIIMVTINYRLGPLGFLSLRTPEYSGNMGLKDQSLAITWIHKNIHHFGGDSNQITIQGLSAGSASIELHILTKNQLFKRAIMTSGSALNVWAITHTDHIPILYRFANKYDYQPNNIIELIDSLLKIDGKHFGNIEKSTHYQQFSSELLLLDLIWVPVVEVENAIDPFLIDLPINMYHNGNFTTNIDLFIGTVANECLFVVDDVLKNPQILEPFNKKFQFELPLNHLNKNINYTSPKYQQIANAVRWHYFQHNSGQVNHNSIYEYVRFLSDILINYGVDYSVKLLSAALTGKTYYYVFSVNSAFNLVKSSSYAHTIGMGGPTHGDDLAYVIGSHLSDGKSDEIYKSVDDNSIERQRMNDFSLIYCNFIKHGIPMVDINSAMKLLPFSSTETNFLNITNDGPKIEHDARYNDMQFWNNIIEISNITGTI